MKQLKLLLLGIISTLLLFVVFIPIKAEAASIIKNGKTIALKDEDSAPLYKMTLEEDSVITVSWTNNDEHGSTISFYTDTKKHNLVTFSFMEKANGKEYFAFKKGVYYVVMADDALSGPTTKMTISWESVSGYNQKNYSYEKAITLSANKTYKLVQTPGRNYDRYYKINITKSPRKVSVIVTYEAIQIVPYKAKINFHIYSEDLGTEYTLTNGTTEEALPVGTYYLVADSIPRPYYNGALGSYITFKWK